MVNSEQYNYQLQETGAAMLEAAPIHVRKAGGDNAGKLAVNRELALQRAEVGKRQILNVSAIRSSDARYTKFVHSAAAHMKGNKKGFNTTSHLNRAAEAVGDGDKSLARQVLGQVEAFTVQAIHDAFSNAPEPVLEKELADIARSRMQTVSREFGSVQYNDVYRLGEDWLIQSSKGYTSVTGQGESLSRDIHAHLLQSAGLGVRTLSVDDMLNQLFASQDPNRVMRRRYRDSVRDCREELSEQMKAGWSDDPSAVLVAGGYVPILSTKRGFSDISTVLLARAAGKAGHQGALPVIEKMHPILTADPNKLFERTSPEVVDQMSYRFALQVFGELRGADGGAVHPNAVQMGQRYGIPIVVADPTDSQRSTVIGAYEMPPNGVELIDSRPIPLALHIQKSGIRDGGGFERRIHKWIQEHGGDPDMWIADETSITIAFQNQPKHKKRPWDRSTLAQLTAFVESIWQRDNNHMDSCPKLVTPQENSLSVVFCMGNNMGQAGPAARATRTLDSIGASNRIISQGMTETSMAFVVDRNLEQPAVEALHRAFVTNNNNELLIEEIIALARNQGFTRLTTIIDQLSQ